VPPVCPQAGWDGADPNCEVALQRSLTDAFLRSAKPPAAGRMEITDARCAGLVFRITSNGAKSWSFRFRVSGRLARATIGQYPALGLTAARAAADTMRKEVAAGGNPVDRKRQDRANAGAKTFGALAGRYLVEHARRKKRSHPADERNLRKHVLPRWKNRPYAAVKRADVIELVEGLVTAGKPTLANRVQSLISSVFTFGMDADLVEANPCHRLRKRGVENVGHRVLSNDEIRLFWPGVVQGDRSRHTGLGLRLALLTAARIGEVAGISRAEIEHISDVSKAAWSIPGARTKNGRDHLIPLSAPALKTVIDLLEMLEPRQQFLFPTRAKRGGPMRANTFWQALDYFSERIPREDSAKSVTEAERTWCLDPPSPHDLRRTVETRLAELRISKEIRDRCLNHIPGDVGSKHYNKYDYFSEKADALNRWATALDAIVTGTAAPIIDLASARGRQR
jgi:integrase